MTIKGALNHKPLKDGTYLVKVRVTHNRVSTYHDISDLKISVKKEAWNQRLGEVRKGHQSDRINALIRKKIEELQKVTIVTENPSTLFEFIQSFINSREQDKTVKPNTIKNYRAVFKAIQAAGQFDYTDINRKWFEGFMSSLKKKGYTKNYIATIVKRLKLSLAHAHDENHTASTEYLKKYFTASEEEVEHIYLEPYEISRIAELTELTPLEERERDRLLIGCWVGLRFSDLIRITPDNFEFGEKPKLKIKAQKTESTNDYLLIPLKADVIKIFEKYDYHSPPKSAEKTANKALKRICKKAKLVKKELFIRTEGGKSVQTRLEKWQLVSTHTGRRSFATNAYESGSILAVNRDGHGA